MATLTEFQSQLKSLRLSENDLSTKLTDLRKRIYRLRIARVMEQYGVRVGSIVANNEDQVYKVSYVRPWDDSKPTLKGHLKKGDRFLKREDQVFGQWKVVES